MHNSILSTDLFVWTVVLCVLRISYIYRHLTKNKKEVAFTLKQYLKRQNVILHGFEARSLRDLPKVREQSSICSPVAKCQVQVEATREPGGFITCFPNSTKERASFFLKQSIPNGWSRTGTRELPIKYAMPPQSSDMLRNLLLNTFYALHQRATFFLQNILPHFLVGLEISSGLINLRWNTERIRNTLARNGQPFPLILGWQLVNNERRKTLSDKCVS